MVRQIKPVQSAVAAVSGILSGTLSTLTLRLPQQPTPGNFLVIVIGSVNGSGPIGIGSVSSPGATWSKAVAQTDAKGAGISDVEIWYAPCVAQNANPTITVTTSSPLSPSSSSVNTAIVAVAAEFPYVAYVSPLDQTASAETDYQSSSTGVTATTTQANELWISGFFICYGGYTADAYGFTIINPGGIPLYTAYMGYLVVSRTGKAQDSLLWQSGGQNENAGTEEGVIATFKLATTPLPSPPNLLTASVDNFIIYT
jgi:hypothetical protein